jgi:hypothetical protein
VCGPTGFAMPTRRLLHGWHAAARTRAGDAGTARPCAGRPRWSRQEKSAANPIRGPRVGICVPMDREARHVRALPPSQPRGACEPIRDAHSGAGRPPRAASSHGPCRPYLPHKHLAAAEVHVFDAQAQAFHQAKPRTVEHRCHSPRDPVKCGQEVVYLLPGEHDAQPLRPFCTHHLIQPAFALQ